jgi:hypothetical protein
VIKSLVSLGFRKECRIMANPKINYTCQQYDPGYGMCKYWGTDIGQCNCSLCNINSHT